MSKVVVQAGQTLTDIAVQHLGNEQGVYELATLNKIDVTQSLSAGQELQLPEVLNKRARRVFQLGQYVPAAYTEEVNYTNVAPIVINLQAPFGGVGVVLPGQTLTDIAVQWLGSEQGVYELAALNGLSITEQVSAGQQLNLPAVYDQQVRRRMEQGQYRPASGLQDLPEGISIWGIEVDFVVQ